MSRWRIAVVVVLLVLPLVVLLGFGSYFLWHEGLGLYVWWPLTTCMGIGYYLMWHWMHKKQLIRPPEEPPPMHWTKRDLEAWKLVEERAKAVAQMQLLELNEFQFYVTLSQEMALDLARFYHPITQDPFSSLTVPEILAVVELAASDLADMVNRNVPGGHLMTIKDWRWAKEAALKATKWYRAASNLYWLGAAILSPVDTALRYTASQLGMSRPFQMFQQDLIAWFHTAYVHRLGAYLIDLNSGRLRVGARRYRELTADGQGRGALEPATPAATATPTTQAPTVPNGEPAFEPARQVTLTILGQVKMGKSSFCNALLGQQRARTGVLPETNAVTRYDLQLPNIDTHLRLLDTVGYAHTGPKQDQVSATEQAAQQSDLLILVLHARSPARQADLEMLETLRRYYLALPHLKMPPVLAVLTHIDLLTPAMEWAPPYNWQQPMRPKEKEIQQALTAVREQLGEFLVGAVPVCAAESMAYGIDEWFLPTLTELLGEARGVGLLRCLRAEVDTGKVRKVFRQLLTVGQQVLSVWGGSLQKK